MSTRLYLVAGPKGDRLVEASSATAARNHVTKDEYSVEPAKPMVVAKLVAAGTKVEVAGEAAEATSARENAR